MNAIIRHFCILTFCFFYTTLFAQQKVGVVLSGGGATAFAHIGVLKALEEKGIPIDYITGTSAGALIGALYAVGMSPTEMEKYVLNDDFLLMATGKLKPNQNFYFKESSPDAGMFSFNLSKDSILQKSLPTNFISSSFLDFEMMKLFGAQGEGAHRNFDSLMVPFRCLASDIRTKQNVLFKEGNLNEVVRASMNYPFYLHPIRVNDVLLFDGGLYNNFPADIMYQEFNPDFIIGSNVSYNAPPPSEDDLISQVTNMLVSTSNFTLPCENGIIINPQTDLNTFDFGSIKKAIEVGYKSTIQQIDSILIHMERIENPAFIREKRAAFKGKVLPINISEITIETKKNKNLYFAEKSLIRKKKNEILSLSKLEKRYYRLYASNQIDFMYPTLQVKEDSTFLLHLKIRKSKPFRIDVGGHFSSRPVNTGFIGLTYRTIGKVATESHVESYFGKFYGSVKGNFKLELPSIYPVSIDAYFVRNRWDYFRSFSTFFEDVQPSFLVQNEIYTGLSFKHPISNNISSKLDVRYFANEDDYYQSDNFTNKDTADYTTFKGINLSWKIEQNTLNRKQFSNSGHYIGFKLKYISGIEHNQPGSTGLTKDDFYKNHQWINLSGEFQTFMLDFKHFHLGIHALGVYNSQSLFSNYTSSILAMSAFSPLPDLESFFLEEYRSPQYLGAGINLIYTLKKHIDFRLDGYFYQPFVKIQKNDDGTFGYSNLFKGDAFLASASVIYHSILGPLRATLNYLPEQNKPLVFQISFGYVLFNERAYR